MTSYLHERPDGWLMFERAETIRRTICVSWHMFKCAFTYAEQSNSRNMLSRQTVKHESQCVSPKQTWLQTYDGVLAAVQAQCSNDLGHSLLLLLC